MLRVDERRLRRREDDTVSRRGALELHRAGGSDEEELGGDGERDSEDRLKGRAKLIEAGVESHQAIERVARSGADQRSNHHFLNNALTPKPIPARTTFTRQGYGRLGASLRFDIKGAISPCRYRRAMIGTIDEVVVDCANPGPLASFWARVLGGEARERDPNWWYVDPPGWSRLAFQRVPESKTVKNRLHLDVEVADIALATAEAEELGATRIGLPHTDSAGAFQVLLDPEGNEWCVVRPSA